MATVKPVLYKSKKRSDGKYLVAIRVTIDRKTKYLFLDWVEEKVWDVKNSRVKKSHPNSARLNNLIKKKAAELDDLIMEKEANNIQYDVKLIFDELDKKKSVPNSFFSYAESFVDQKRQLGKHGQHITDKGRVKQFQTFLNGKDITFNNVTVALLNQYQVHLKVKYKVSKRTIVNHMILIRTIYNKAIKEGVAKREHYPFGKDGIKIRIPKTTKIGLTLEEIERIENFEIVVGTEMWHSRNIFLFSFYFAGMRISDVLSIRWNDIVDGRLLYKMNKNDKSGGVKISSKAETILDRYRADKEKKDDFIFPALKKADLTSTVDVYRKIKSNTRKINKYLKIIAEKTGIEKNVSCHIARHSFGNIAGDKIPIQMLQKLYRHSDIQTTIGYQSNFMFKDTDEALEAVIGA